MTDDAGGSDHDDNGIKSDEAGVRHNNELGPVTESDPSINQDISPVHNNNKSLVRKFSHFITVEPMLFLHMCAWSTTTVNVQSFYLEKICENEYKTNPSICSNLTDNPGAESHVEGIATLYSTYRSLIEAGLPVLFSLFIGPWSDRHGSKGPMILPLIGYLISSILLYLFSMAEDLNPALILLASVPVALTGGVIAFILSAFRFVAAITKTENRSFRIAIAEGSWFLGSPIGLLGSAALLKVGGFQLVFSACIAIFFFAAIYAFFFIKNDKPENEHPDAHIIKDMFNFEAVKDTFFATFRERPGSQRLWIILLLGTLYIRIFTLFGSMTVTLLYTRKKFQWDTAEYSAYTTYDGIIAIVGSSIVAVLGMKVFKIPDSFIGLISAVSYFFGAIVWFFSSFTTFGWMMYLGATVQMFCGLISIITRSMISKIVSKDELGKVYSFLASGEAAIPIFSAPIYNFVYGRTVDDFPGTVYIINAGLNFFVVISFIYFILYSWRRGSSGFTHSELNEERNDGNGVHA